MPKRHLFNSTDGLVNKAIRGIIAYNPYLSLIESHRVVYHTGYDRSQVTLISGGGSGHEPAWTGYVGINMLTAAVQGDIFASPSTQQIVAAIQAVPSDQGTILVLGNYTGDCLHFGLANEKANALGHNCRVIICGDDVSIGKQGRAIGRRGLAGQIAVLKVLGAAAGAKGSLDEVFDLGVALSEHIVSIAATLNHCHVPGRKAQVYGAEDEIEVGTGPHNEPGYIKLSPVPSASELIKKILTICLDQNDPERSYVKFGMTDDTVLLVNNFGGISQLEMGALVDEILQQLACDWGIEPLRIYAGCLETSLDADAFSISIINITASAKVCQYSPEQILDFFDARTTTHWESMTGSQKLRRSRLDQVTTSREKRRQPVACAQVLKVNPILLERMLRNACGQLIDAEPDLTEWDTVLGDGDCGETLKTGAAALLSALDEGLAIRGCVIEVLQGLEELVESRMGGTLGGILAILLVSLRAAIENTTSTKLEAPTPRLWGKALSKAIESLRCYTPARVGDRTILDVLIPFAKALEDGDFADAVQAAKNGAEATKEMTPRLGRATYVNGGSLNGHSLPPDPGAWGAFVAIRGLFDGLREGHGHVRSGPMASG